MFGTSLELGAWNLEFFISPTETCRVFGVCYILRVMPANNDPDAALMLRVKKGDREAFTQLVEKYKQPVINLAWRTLRDETEAEDLAQTVFLQVFKSAHRYQSTAKFSTWLFTIARNLCLNEIRRRSRHPADSMDAAHPSQEDQPLHQFEETRTPAPPESLLRGELEQKVEQAIGELPENQRTALLLCREEELSYEEIAEVLGCSLSATKSLIHRGRETLKQKLKPYLKTGHWTAQK
jgi:RNA polymerase sigma-70 factor, ECF subfamily